MSASFWIASRSSSNSAASTGKRPQNTTCCAFLNPGKRRVRALAFVGQRVADLGVGDLLDGRGQKADFAGAELVDRHALGREHADAIDLIDGVRRHHADALALLDFAVDDAEQHDDAEIGVVPAVDQQRLQRFVEVAFGRRQALVTTASRTSPMLRPVLAEIRHRLRSVDADHVFDLLADALGFGGGQIDLVEDRHDVETGVDRLIDVGQRLRLDALAGVHDQQRAFAGGQAARDLVAEVDVAGRVHQVQDVGFAVLGRIGQAHGLRLDRDAALALDIHRVRALGPSYRAHRARRKTRSGGRQGWTCRDRYGRRSRSCG